ncbi:YdcF family protein [Christensenella timonensis]|uniref:YdcF family protein n=1 Tax=Christensenella timonensis TaxID=1816678 RepID=UPI0008338BBF|nr:YdcF family protein [Christensenella timonensis]
MDENTLKHDIDTLSRFLARRDLCGLSPAALAGAGFSRVDVLFVFGCEVIPVIECAAQAASQGLCNTVVFSGGIGHSTQNLVHTARELFGEECGGLPEADIMARIAIRHYGMDPSIALCEGKSTNSGENARFSLALLKERGISLKSAMLMQDPFMQLRSHFTLLKYLRPGVPLLSYAPFIPYAGMPCGSENGLWSKERFREFLLREIPRLRDDENGYGPKGAGFMEHVDIPSEVEQSYARICRAYGE